MTMLSQYAARARLGVHPSVFSRLVRAGVYRRDRFGLFCAASLEGNHAAAVEIEREADAQIAAIRRDVARCLAKLGAPTSHERTTP